MGLRSNWTAFAEYNYLDFGTPAVNFLGARSQPAGSGRFPLLIPIDRAASWG